MPNMHKVPRGKNAKVPPRRTNRSQLLDHRAGGTGLIDDFDDLRRWIGNITWWVAKWTVIVTTIIGLGWWAYASPKGVLLTAAIITAFGLHSYYEWDER
jgi:hypothetical protein